MIKKRKLSSPILLKYLEAYEKNPKSKVFAPLAEAYRKLGLIEEAIKILKNGIKNHSDYTLGHLTLGQCYFEQGKYELSYRTLRPLMAKNIENISMQKLFAETCLKIGHVEEALESFKYLLFINPKNINFKEQVRKLENHEAVKEKYLQKSGSNLNPQNFFNENDEEYPFETHNINEVRQSSEEQWIEVNFIDKEKGENDFKISKEESSLEISAEKWVLNRQISQIPSGSVESGPSVDLSDTEKIEFHEEKFSVQEIFDVPDKDESEDYSSQEQLSEENLEEAFPRPHKNDPVITHTLVDLYCAQGYYHKGIEILEKILILNPIDSRTLARLAELKEFLSKNFVDHKESQQKTYSKTGYSEIVVDHDDLWKEAQKSTSQNTEANLLDGQLQNERLFLEGEEKICLAIETKFNFFLKKIKQRAQSYSTAKSSESSSLLI